MSDQELDSMWHMSRPYFRAAVREAIAAETRKLVDALRSIVRPHGWPSSNELRQIAAIVAEYDAQQRPAFGDGQAAFDAAQQQKGT